MGFLPESGSLYTSTPPPNRKKSNLQNFFQSPTTPIRRLKTTIYNHHSSTRKPSNSIHIGVREGTSDTSGEVLFVGLKMVSDSKPVGVKKFKKAWMKKKSLVKALRGSLKPSEAPWSSQRLRIAR